MKWYKVELHTHTLASDGDMEPDELVNNAIKRGYDAICLTDHNTISNVEKTIELGNENGLVVVGGIEWTTFWGHIVVTGRHSDIDWRELNPSNIDSYIEKANSMGDLVTLAHPKRLGYPFCCGCHCDYEISAWDKLHAYEVWSKFTPNTNSASIRAKKEWSELIEQGYKIAPVYGYDWHAVDDGCPPYAYTYVGMDGEISADKIIKAIKKRHTVVSMGINVNCFVEQNGKKYYPGDILSKGKAVITISGLIDEDYSKNYKTSIKSIKLLKNNQLFLVKKWEGEKIELPIDLLDGNVRIEVFGNVNGNDGEIAIISPYYIEV